MLIPHTAITATVKQGRIFSPVFLKYVNISNQTGMFFFASQLLDYMQYNSCVLQYFECRLRPCTTRFQHKTLLYNDFTELWEH